MEITIAIILGFIPGVVWLLYFYFKDKNREPKKLIVLTFLVGFLMIIPAAIIEIGLEKFFPALRENTLIINIISSFLIVGLIEEAIKLLALFKTIFKRINFDEFIDGIIYGVSVGFGFASSENILAIWKIGENIIIPRSFSATLIHGLTAGIIGYYLSVYKFRDKKKIVLLKGLFLAILFHGLYNLVVTYLTAESLWILIGFMVLVYLFLFIKIRKAKYIDNSQLVVRNS